MFDDLFKKVILSKKRVFGAKFLFLFTGVYFCIQVSSNTIDYLI